MQDSITHEALEALNQKATQGEWTTGGALEANYLYAGGHHISCMSSSADDGRGGDIFDEDDSEAVANAKLAAALINLYRTGQLILAQPSGDEVEAVKVPRGVIAFLKGRAPLKGAWFGERHPTEPGSYWWRKYLPDPDTALDAARGKQ